MREYSAEVSGKKYLTPEVLELRLRMVKPRSFKFRAGQFVFFNIGGAFKAYSMTSLPADRHRLRFLIRLEPGGVGSNFINRLKIGQRLEFTGPEGNFIIKAKKQNICCLGIGIGIAPFLAIIPHQLQKNFSRRLTLIYGARAKQEIFYHREFKNLERRHRNFNFIPLAGQRVAEYLNIHYPDYHKHIFYICGKPRAVSDVESLLKVFGHNEAKIRVESFLR